MEARVWEGVGDSWSGPSLLSRKVPAFPGAPVKWKPPLYYGDYSIYTDAKCIKWRVKLSGVRVDKKFLAKTDPEDAWKREFKHIGA